MSPGTTRSSNVERAFGLSACQVGTTACQRSSVPAFWLSFMPTWQAATPKTELLYIYWLNGVPIWQAGRPKNTRAFPRADAVPPFPLPFPHVSGCHVPFRCAIDSYGAPHTRPGRLWVGDYPHCPILVHQASYPNGRLGLTVPGGTITVAPSRIAVYILYRVKRQGNVARKRTENAPKALTKAHPRSLRGAFGGAFVPPERLYPALQCCKVALVISRRKCGGYVVEKGWS